MSRREELWVLATRASVYPDECRIWPHATDGRGYGILRGNQRVHRIVCEWRHGPAPEGTEAAHFCGNSLCVNPMHLRWATHAENCADKSGHGTALIGERHHQAKLTWSDVNIIRASTDSLQTLSQRYGVSRSQISRIRRGEKWGAS